jgi:diguanylate cyclase (GGDEF)-like protein
MWQPRILTWLSSGDARTSIPRAMLIEQLRILSRQVPICYLVLIVNYLSIACALPAAVPWPLRVGVPVCFTAVAFAGLFRWKIGRKPAISESALEYLSRAPVPPVLLSFGCCLWGSLLFQRVGVELRLIIVLLDFLAAAASAYCLASFPRAAAIVLLASVLPIFLRMLGSGDPLLIYLACDLLIVTLLLMMMLSTYHYRLVKLVTSRVKTAARHERSRIAEAIALEEKAKAHEMAETDTLTKLPNRRGFLNSLDRTIERHTSENSAFAVAMLDLDGFKPINDAFGHAIGDLLLVEVARRLLVAAGPESIVARLGGDEFSIIWPHAGSSKEACQTAATICDDLAKPFSFEHVTIRLSASCGVALFPDGGREASRLLEHADMALYNTKRNGRNGVSLFSNAIENHLRRKAEIEQMLQSPDVHADLAMVFQPIVNLQGLRLASFEALARWNSETHGNIPPDEFIPLAEQAGFVADVGDVLFEKAIVQAAKWPKEITLSFNLSALQLCSSTTPLRLLSIMSGHYFEPARLSIEITETALLADFDTARYTIQELRAAGMRIVLDDFGAGHSWIGYLREMVFDAIKIDGALVDNIVHSQESRALLSGVLRLCCAIGTPTIAERVETRDQAEILKELGCNAAQGFLFGRPMLGDDAQGFIMTSVGESSAA